MSCHGCADSFGFWKREIGCPGCGYSYCQKCLRHKITVPDDTTRSIMEKVVCSKCYIEANEKHTKNSNLSPEGDRQAAANTAAKAVEVLEGMDTPIKHPITVYKEQRFSNLKRGMSIEDQKLVERLEELRNFISESKRKTSDQPDQDIAERLAKLKGMEYKPATGSSSPLLMKQKPETENDLLNRYTNEVSIDKNYKDSLVSDIEARLAKLKGNESPEKSRPGNVANCSAAGIPSECDDRTEEEQVNDIINRYIREVELESKLKEDGEGDDEERDSDPEAERRSTDALSLDDDVDDEQLCRICDEKRAVALCKECDGDIFCRKCFKEFHDEIGESHKPYPVKEQKD